MSRYVMQCPVCGHWRGFLPSFPLSPRTVFHCYYCDSRSHVMGDQYQQLLNYHLVDELELHLVVQELNKDVFEGGPVFE